MNDGPDLRTPSTHREASAFARGADVASRVWHHVPFALTAARGHLLRRRAKARLASISLPYRLCLGSGRAPIPGWTNVDFYFPSDVQLDLRFGIPIPDDSVELIYSEHLIEHLSLEANLQLFRECRRVLAPAGRMRIATPDLAEIVRDYRTDWRRHDWVKWDEYSWVDSGTRMVNAAVRDWGHVYIWDYEELAQRLAGTGFANLERHEIGESAREALRGLETRADSHLVVEAGPGKADA